MDFCCNKIWKFKLNIFFLDEILELVFSFFFILELWVIIVVQIMYKIYMYSIIIFFCNFNFEVYIRNLFSGFLIDVFDVLSLNF